MLTAIRQWVLKTMMKNNTGVVQTLPKKDLVEFNVQMTAERLARNGINPQDLKNVNQVENAINQIEAPRNVDTGIRNTESAKILDMQGKEIPKGSQIMGGKQVETEAEIAARMSKENKESAQRIKNKKMLDDAIDNASPGFAGDRKYDAQLVADDLADKRFGKDFYDLDEREQMKLYDEAYQGLSKQRFKNRKKPSDADDQESSYDDGPADFDPNADNETFATGGRAGFKGGLGKRFLELLKGKPKLKFDEKRFKEGPIDLNFLENVDKKDIEKFIRTRDTVLPSGYGMYKNLADMPAGLRAAELIKTIRTKDGGINYRGAELFLGKKLRGDESVDELLQILNRQEMRAEGGRIGYKNGKSLLDFIDVKASGSKAGKQQIQGAPKGFTTDAEQYNFVANLNIPVTEKINLLANIVKGKSRDRIEKDNNELFLMDDGYKNRNIGLSINEGGEGFRGSILRNLETGDDNLKVELVKRFAEGGRAGLKSGASKAFLEFLKKFKVKQSGDDLKDFLSKRQFMKDMVGNTKANEQARELAMLKEAMKDAKGFEFPSGKELRTDIEKTMGPILLKDRKLNATGGRIGLKAGMSKRAFLKLMGGVGTTIGAAKSGIFSGFGKGAGKEVAKEVVKKSTSTPPAYFFELANKIKTLGRVTDGPQERLKIHTMPAKDGKSELMLTEDLGTGEMQIKKIGKEGDEMVTEVQTMEYVPGSSQADETTKGIPADSYEEFTEYNSRIYKDEFNDPMIEDGIKVDEIVEEVKDQAPSIKKASGGIARMLGE